MNWKNPIVRTLVECAALIGFGTVLADLRLLHMPYGGAVTMASMLPFIIISCRHGVGWGLFAGAINAFLQMYRGYFYMPPAGTTSALVTMIVLDYVLAFMVLGLAGLFRGDGSRKRVVISIVAVCFLRFLCSFISGIVVWGDLAEPGVSLFVYSLKYNGLYMGVETVVTIIPALFLHGAFPTMFCHRKKLPVETEEEA